MNFDYNSKIAELKKHAKNMRILALDMAYKSGCNAHLGGGLSFIDASAVLYGEIMNIKDKSLSYAKKDKFILSKGHGVLGLYSALAEFNIIDKSLLDTFMCDDSDLIAHPVMNPEIGIESSSGSLGQGISMAVGLAIAAKKKKYSYQTYVVCGNGECNEGSVWEACMAAINFKLDNLTIFIDNNKMQSDGISANIMNVSDKYSNMFKALSFQTIEIDGNNITELYNAFMKSHIEGCPKVVIGNTIKGKGISFMENNKDWHHNRLIEEYYTKAIEELRTTEC